MSNHSDSDQPTLDEHRAYVYAIELMKEENRLLKQTIIRMKGEMDQLKRGLEEALRSPPWDAIHSQQKES